MGNFQCNIKNAPIMMYFNLVGHTIQGYNRYTAYGMLIGVKVCNVILVIAYHAFQLCYNIDRNIK